MNSRQLQKLATEVRAIAPEAILRAVDLCDGHGILNPQALLTAGLPENVVVHLTRTYKSDTRDPKATLFVNGQAVKELTGVYGLEALRFLAWSVGAEYPRALGRGFEARNIQRALHEHFASVRTKPS